MATPQPLTRRGLAVDPTLQVLSVVTLANTVGNGATMTMFPLYLTRTLGLSVGQTASLISVSALGALLTQLPLADWGDRTGLREGVSRLMAVAAVAAAALVAARTFWVLLVVLLPLTVADRGASAVRSGLIARVAPAGQAVAFKAYLRAVTNVGIGAGSALAGLALWADVLPGYLALLSLDAVSFAVAAWLSRRLPAVPPAPPRERGEPRLQVLHDLPYVVATVLLAVVTVHFLVLELAVPLWLVGQHHGPRWLPAVLTILNTAAVATFQVRLSRGSATVPGSARSVVVGAAWVAAALVLFGLVPGAGWWLVALAVVAAGVHVVGEMIGSGGQWGIQMGLAPRERQGQYQGFGQLAFGLPGVVGPPVIAWLCLGLGRPGWLLLAAAILTAALALVPASRWALTNREQYGVTSHTG